MLWTILLLSIFLLGMSTWTNVMVVRAVENKTNHIISLFLSGVFLLSLIILTIFIMTDHIGFVPSWVFWMLIMAGVVIGVASVVKKHIPSQIMSLGLLLFTAVVTLFSIGIILFVLFIIQFVITIINWKRNGLGVV